MPQDLYFHREKFPTLSAAFSKPPWENQEEKKKSTGNFLACFFPPPQDNSKVALRSLRPWGESHQRQTLSTRVVAGLPGSPGKQNQAQQGNPGHGFLGRHQRNTRILPLLFYLHHWQQPRIKLTTGENHKGNSLGPEKCPSGHKSCLNISAISQTEIIIANYKIIFM